jgi:N-acetylmuramoyl-L-alanine amidase
VRVALDPGHGGSDPGAVGHGLHEADITLQVARLLKKELTAAGHEVLMTRSKDRYVSLGERARLANVGEADLFVSLHCNAAARPEVEGMEIFSFPGSDKGEELAAACWSALGESFDLIASPAGNPRSVSNWQPSFRVDVLGRPVHRARGLKEANFAVLRLTHMPAVLVEMEFITNERQARNLADPAWQLRMAKALAAGIGGA